MERGALDLGKSKGRDRALFLSGLNYTADWRGLSGNPSISELALPGAIIG
jgi:hypothetical protein